MKNTLIIVTFLLTACTGCDNYNDGYQWFKGNTHTHTTVSDGDKSPKEVIAWYHEHGYNFLLITDHNIFLNIDTLPLPVNHRKDFILIPAEEVTDKKFVHTTAMNCNGYVPFSGDEEVIKDPAMSNQSVSQLIQLHVDGISDKGGICILNHPNFKSGAQIEDILKVKGLTHIEVYNGHSSVRTWGQEGEHIPVEAKWDSLLSKGYLLYGIASDDAHNYKKINKTESNPGRGWIMVHSRSLVPDSIAKGVRMGDFYSTMGIIISKTKIENGIWKIKVDERATKLETERSNIIPRIDKEGNPGFIIEFIGINGKVISSVPGTTASFTIPTSEKYVRARVTFCTKTPDGYEKQFAWLQPYVIDRTFFTF